MTDPHTGDAATIDGTQPPTAGNGPLRPWMHAIVQSLHTLAAALNVTDLRFLDDQSPQEGGAGNYIYLYGEKYAYRIGILGTMPDFTNLVRMFVGAAPTDALADSEVYDGIGEMANILVGTVRTVMSADFPHLSIGLPMMTTGAIVYPTPEHTSSIRARLDRSTLTIVAHAHPLPSEVRRQRLLELEVRDREARLQSILDTAADAILTVDEDNLIDTMNNAALRAFGVEAADVVRHPVERVLPGLPVALSSSGSASHDGRPREMVGRRGPNGVGFPVEVSHSELSTGGRRTRIVIARDLTRRKEMEAAINQSKRLDAIGQLAAGIAHEINTPIQFVGDNANFLRQSFDDILSLLPKYERLRSAANSGAVTPELLEEILAAEAGIDLAFLCQEIPQAITQSLEGVERVASIVAAMKAFSHPGKDKVPADINKALQTTLTVSRNEWKYVADLTTSFDEGLPLVPCVIGEVNQVFINLIVNAAHAIAEKNGDTGGSPGRIAVETRREGKYAEIRISDTGGGIPAAVRERIFEPFFTTKDVGKGTGQGLSISHSVIVKKHGGQLSFQTEEGVGTTFCVRLPIDPDYAA